MEDSRGFDLLQGLGANRDSNATEETVLIYASTSLHPYVDETDVLTLVIDQHFAPSAYTEITLYYGLGA